MKGLKVSNFIVPMSVIDTYPTNLDIFGRGGIHSVDTIPNRDAITTERRSEGMFSFVKNNESMYALLGGITNDKWCKLFDFSDNTINFDIACDHDYVLLGNKDGVAKPSPRLRDMQFDIIDLRREFDKIGILENLDHNKIWIGDYTNRPVMRKNIGVINLPVLGAATFPYPSMIPLPPVPIPNPTFNPFSGMDWLMSGPWLPQIFSGSPDTLNESSETIISSSLAMTQIRVAQAIKRLDVGSFIVKKKTIDFSWENPAMMLIPEAIKSLYGLSTSYTFTNAQALDELEEGLLLNSKDGTLSIVKKEDIAPSNAKYIIQEPDTNLPNAQALSSLGFVGGMLRSGANGVISIASGGTIPVVNDYITPANLLEEKTERTGADTALETALATLEAEIEAEIAILEAEIVALEEEIVALEAELVTLSLALAALDTLLQTEVSDLAIRMATAKVIVGNDGNDKSVMTGSGYLTLNSSLTNNYTALQFKEEMLLDNNEYYFSMDTNENRGKLWLKGRGEDDYKPLTFGFANVEHTTFPYYEETTRGFDMVAGFDFDGDIRKPRYWKFRVIKHAYKNYPDDDVEDLFEYWRETESINFYKTIDLKNHKLTGLLNGVDNSDAVNLGQLNSIISNVSGTVTSVGITSNSPGLSVSGSPITSSGTINLTLGLELQALSAFATTGLIARTGSNTYVGRILTAGTGISITNGDGITGNPIISLSSPITNLTLTGAITGTGTNNINTTLNHIQNLSDLGLTFNCKKSGSFAEYDIVYDLQESNPSSHLVQTVSTGSGTTKRSWDLIFRPGNSSSPSGTFIIQFYHYLIGRKDVINIQYNGTNFDTTFDSDIIMSNRKIKELPTPTTFDQPATKGYADSLVKNIPASSLANYPSDNTKYLRGDGVWSPVSGGGTSSGATVGDFKFSCIGDDHAGWTLWIQNRVLSRTTYKALYDTVRQWALVESDDPKINIPNAIFGRGDGGTTFTMKDISSRYIGISGQNVSGLTTRLPCVRVGAETITSVPNHSHTMSHTHNATISTNNHTHSTSGHTHSINHTHSSFNTTSFSHSHDLVTFNLNGTNSSLDTVVYQYTSQSSGSGGGYTDYDGSGGVTPFRVIYNVGLRKTTSSVSQSLNINIPTFSGTSGGSSETISSASHTHTCDISSNNSSTGSTGDSSVNVMNPGIFFEMFIYTGALEPPEL